jgi:hypothetical protein
LGGTISYFGGQATFYREGELFRMRLERGDVRRDYTISQTIGSRFFQYYVGRQYIVDEEESSRPQPEDYVLPFGYWLGPAEWVPVVHIVDEVPDGERADPFAQRPDFHDYQYSRSCNYCHTTFPLGDMLVRESRLMGRHAPRRLHWFASGYLAAEHPQLFDEHQHPADMTDQQVNDLINQTKHFDAVEHAVSFGISCEACHLGSKQHAEGQLKKPHFFPRSGYLHVETSADEIEFGRTHANVNWACGRCHSGTRPEFAAGIGTWNSIEYSDAAKGACYSQLTCIDCHNPHQTIGQKWSNTPDQDDARCLKCHQEYQSSQARQAHTHHPIDSAGSRCMNCHMSRINEGMQDVVRTHTIFSPSNSDMIKANHPNACNLCHTDRNIDWTLDYLEEWYQRRYPKGRIAANYPDREQPVAIGWITSENESLRLVAADALFRNDDRWAVEHLLDALDDPFLLNRQFARLGIEQMFGISLADFGYRFYMSPAERREPLQKIRESIVAKPNAD